MQVSSAKGLGRGRNDDRCSPAVTVLETVDLAEPDEIINEEEEVVEVAEKEYSNQVIWLILRQPHEYAGVVTR